MPGESEKGEGRVREPGEDFADHPAYQAALHFCGMVLDLESKFPDDERPVLYASLKRCAIEAGSLIASGFGRSRPEVRLELWEKARSRVMESRHLVMVARMRYVVDSRDVEKFEALYFDLIEGIEVLIGTAAGAGFSANPPGGPSGRN